MSQVEICWYHPKITREEGESKLHEDPRNTKGLFIVRDSVSSPGDYVLSVLCDGEVHNYQIRKSQEDSFFSITEDIKIHGLEKLINYYKTNPLSEDGLMLTDFVKGVQPPPETKRSGSANLLHRATLAGDNNVVSELLQSGYAYSDAKNHDGQTAAHLAAIAGRSKILELLITHQVNVNLRDAMGFTPLHYACKFNQPECVKLLITLGNANIQAQNTESGEVPLHIAASEGHLKVIEILLSFNAPLNPRTIKKLVPAQLARKKGHMECALFLESFRCPTPKVSIREFYHGTLDRQEAEEKIRNFNAQSGVFLVRFSERNNVDILSVYHDERVWHYMIQKEGSYLFIDNGPLLNSMEHLVEYFSSLSDGLPTVLTVPVPPPRKPDAPPISTLRKSKLTNVRPKIAIPQQNDLSPDNIPTPLLFQNIAFVSDISLANGLNNNNNNINNNHDDLPNYVIDPKKLFRGDLIGEGEFASVFKGVYIGNDGEKIKVAIKTLHNEHSETNKENFRREAQVMLNLSHHCIVKSLGICEGPPLQMIQELVPLGSILQYVLTHYDELRPEFEFKIWASQIACGMNYLEENRFVHRDLAARNILLASKTQAKISDFGLSRTLDVENMYKAAQGGRWPLKWYAPESYQHGHFDHKSDVWSFGVTIWEIYSYGATPYGDMKGKEAIELIDRGQRLQKPEACPDDIYEKMLECWSTDKDERPTFKELVEFFYPTPEFFQSSPELLQSSPEYANVS